ncbi:short chain dehydrogenase [Nitzschia inconspicua]|uniref:Short chain dehydrogenase n=1 Tax=Nitzschia inconspicua TaxID=303405 RepID=A0A9K3KBF0_9STRA|nr:short chain dehydrogenase [Nitzschia inconspicua]
MVYTVQDKVVLVTGANRGIGKALVEAFLRYGARKVYAAVRNIDSAKATFPEACEEAKVIPVTMDLSKPETIQTAAEIATDVEIVINNAGIISHTGPLDDNTVERLQEEMTVNVYGLIAVARAFVPFLEQRNGCGILVQLNSVASLRCGVSSVATYSASKAASFSLTQAMRQELKPKGIHVVSVHPGPIATEMLADALKEFLDVAEPPSNVAERLIDALTSRNESCDKPNPPFLVYPDEKSAHLGTVYERFAKRVVEEGHSYG